MKYLTFKNSITKSDGEFKVLYDCTNKDFKQTEDMCVVKSCFISDSSLKLVVEAYGEVCVGTEFEIETTGEFEITAVGSMSVEMGLKAMSVLSVLVIDGNMISFDLVDIKSYLRCGVFDDISVDDIVSRGKKMYNKLVSVINKRIESQTYSTKDEKNLYKHLSMYGVGKDGYNELIKPLLSSEAYGEISVPTDDDILTSKEEYRSYMTLLSIYNYNK